MSTTTRLTLSLDVDAASRGRHVKDVVQSLARLHGVRGALVVAPDGFVIASQLPAGLEIDALAALTATLGRELEVNAARLGRPAFDTALFSADDGTLVLGGSPIGFVMALAELQAGLQSVRSAVRDAATLLRAAWAAADP